MSERIDRIARLEMLLKELCEAIVNDRHGIPLGHPTLRYEADRIMRELSVEHPEADVSS